MSEHNPSKRKFIKTVTYVAPAILTLKVAPSFASTGSGRGPRNNDDGHDNDSSGGHQNQGRNKRGNGRDGDDRSGGHENSRPQGYRSTKRNR